jgi:iron complex outermembrane recepter protein
MFLRFPFVKPLRHRANCGFNTAAAIDRDWGNMFKKLAIFVTFVATGDMAAYAQPTPDERGSVTSIVVTAQRLKGSIDSLQSTEFEISGAAVTGLGASNLGDVIAQISAQTGGNQGRGGEDPYLLVNGRRISSFDEVKNLPPEAVERVEILPEEAAVRFGFPPHQKLINVVLVSHYSATTYELEDRVATRTGRNDFNTEMNTVRINGQNRMTFDLQYNFGDHLLESQRGVDRALSASPSSYGGIVRSALLGSEIDPALSIVAGRSLLLASAPTTTARPPLTAFLTTAPRDDSGNARTLIPASEQFTADASFARGLNRSLSFSAIAKLDRQTNQALLGPAAVKLTLPSASPFSPFSRDIVIGRYGDPNAIIYRATRTDTARLGTLLTGFGPWQWSLIGNFNHVAVRRTTDGDVDSSRFQNALLAGAPSANPFGPLTSSAFERFPAKVTNSVLNSLSLEATVSGSPFTLPAGDAIASARVNGAGDRLKTTNDGGQVRTLRRNLLGGQASLELPILSDASPVGSLSTSANLFLNDYSDAGQTTNWGWNVNWQPWSKLSLLLAGSRESAVPTMQQLGDPFQTTPTIAFFDFGTGQSLAAARLDGGDAGLKRDRRSLIKAQATYKPIKGLSIVATYTKTGIDNPLLSFPGISPAFVAAFPGRIVRDERGAITQVDTRPVNFAREDRSELRWGISFSRDFSKGKIGPKVPGGGGFGGGHSFGAHGSMVQAALYHNLRFYDRVALASGQPAFDLISHNQLGDGIRVPRHKIEAQLSATRHAIGVRANAVWTSAGNVAVGTAGQLNFDSQLVVGMRIFFFPGQREKIAAAAPWLKGVRLLIAIDNPFDTYLHVRDQSGFTPIAYQRGLLEPLGRTIRFSVRKTF